MNPQHMQEALNLALENVRSGRGGPFGAVVVKAGIVVGRGTNMVTATNDPSAHAEVMAIREACKKLGSFQLDDCELYTSCEPCPMCLGAIYWARPKAVYYAANRQDASNAGFDDAFIYDELLKPLDQRTYPLLELKMPDKLEAFGAWKASQTKVRY